MKGEEGNKGIFIWSLREAAIREPLTHSFMFIHVPHLKALVLLRPDSLEPLNSYCVVRVQVHARSTSI